MQAWADSYTYTSDFVRAYHVVLPDEASVIQQVATNQSYSFGVVGEVAIYDAVAMGLLPFPFAAYACVFPFKLSAIGNESLVLDEDILVGIYTGSIQYWDHPDITALNPVAALPHQRIKPIIYTTDSAATSLFSKGLQLNSVWNATVSPPVGTNITYPIENDPETLFATGAKDFPNVLANNDYSIGFAIQSDMLGYDYTQIGFKRSKSIVFPTLDAIEQAMDSLESVVKPYLFGALVNPPDISAWPFTSFAYTISSSTFASDCDRQIQFASYLTWAQNNDGARDVGYDHGYVPLSIGLRNQAQDYGSLTECNDRFILDISIITGMGTHDIEPVMTNWARIHTLTVGSLTSNVDYTPASSLTVMKEYLDRDLKFAAISEIIPA